MQNAEYSYIKYTFPFIFSSKFNILTFSEQPYIRRIEFSLDLNKVYTVPEILFWAILPINDKKPSASFFFRKRYSLGKGFLTKEFLSVFKVFSKKQAVFNALSKVFQKMILSSQEITLFRGYPFRDLNSKRMLFFYNISFDDKYNILVDLAPSLWNLYSLRVFILPFFCSGFHFRFFLQFLRMPIA